MKYEFKKISLDDYELIYTNQEQKEVHRPFKMTNDIAIKLQSSVARARLRMNAEMNKMGLKPQDLITETVNEQGKKVVDESLYISTEKGYIEQEQGLTLYQILDDCFGDIEDLATDIGLKNDNEIGIFMNKFLMICTGKEKNTPSLKEEN